jgi:D-glycero-alpha-D-manno-heptose-7-phosphate kinase
MNTDIQWIHAKAPTRIDLAGGTVDLWPLYLFLDRPVTLNLGIDLYAETRVEIAPSTRGTGVQAGEVTLKSEDQGHELKFGWSELHSVQAPPQLELHLKFLRYFARERLENRKDYGFNLTIGTRAKSPAGAGLGGSSTLSISMIGALATWARQGTLRETVDVLRDGEKMIEIARDVETTVIQVPAGVQDYYGAMFGGLQSLRWSAGSHQREWLPTDILSELQKRVLLFYSGQSRNSGINNWALFKGFVDNQNDIRARFAKITEATRKLETALRAHNWMAAGEAIAEEWATRKTLAPGISTPEMDQAFAAAQKITPIAGKVCGAGGGGCFFVYLENQLDQKSRIEEAFVSQGMRSLPFHAVPRGLEIQVARG